MPVTRTFQTTATGATQRGREGRCVSSRMSTATRTHNSLNGHAVWHPTGNRRAQGFSLIETLVVIGIISILVSLVVASGVYLNGRAKQSQTRGILAALAAIDTEYRGQVGPPVDQSSADWATEANTFTFPIGSTTVGAAGQPSDTSPNASIERFVIKAKQVSQTATMIDNLINNTRDDDNNNFAEIVDGWGNAIAYRNQESAFGTFPARNSPFFVSAGADGKFGSSNPSVDADAKDNLYSYELE
jgi:prepilin-type N-terminal cleavage/methylation domain-containing protein